MENVYIIQPMTGSDAFRPKSTPSSSLCNIAGSPCVRWKIWSKNTPRSSAP